MHPSSARPDAAPSPRPLPAAADEVNIYSSRHYDTDETLYSDFTEATGIKVNRIEGTPEELIARMQAEGANSPADIFLTVDAGRIWLADREACCSRCIRRCSTSASPSTCAIRTATGTACRSARA